MQYTVKQARLLADLTQAEMAEKLGVSAPTYIKYEHDPTQMRLDRLIKFSKVTGIDLMDLRYDGIATLGKAD